jgi:hypothetical protein
MGFLQQIGAFAIFIVRSLSAWVRSLLPARTPTPAPGPALALAPVHEGEPSTTAPPTLVAGAEPPGAHIHLPSPTIWPAMIAFGVTLFGFGVMSSLTFAICGAIILLLGVAGWIQELRHA